MHKVGICGGFSYGMEVVGGQTIRARMVAQALENEFGRQQVLCVDTTNWKNNPIGLLFECIKLSIQCKNIIILPAHNGVKVFVPLFLILGKLFGSRLHYIVIGAWLADSLDKTKWLLHLIKQLDCVYVQTETLKRKLGERGIASNVILFPNFKVLSNLDSERSSEKETSPHFRTCILSRINRMKGVEDAINVIADLNVKYRRTVITLDIYGPIEGGYEDEFYSLIKTYGAFVSYKGNVDYDQTITVLKQYSVLLFPTRYFTEGFPGTLLDALFSGLPVLASQWESYSDIVDENMTGLTYRFNDNYDFSEKLEYLMNHPEKCEQMRIHCLEKSLYYTADRVIQSLINNLF